MWSTSMNATPEFWYIGTTGHFGNSVTVPLSSRHLPSTEQADPLLHGSGQIISPVVENGFGKQLGPFHAHTLRLPWYGKSTLIVAKPFAAIASAIVSTNRRS